MPRIPQTLVKYRRGTRLRFGTYFSETSEVYRLFWSGGEPCWIERRGYGDVKLVTPERTLVELSSPARLKAAVATPGLDRLITVHEHPRGARLAISDARGVVASTEYPDRDASVVIATNGDSIVVSAFVEPVLSIFSHALDHRRPWPFEALRRQGDACKGVSSLHDLGDSLLIETGQTWSRWTWGGKLLESWPIPTLQIRLFPGSKTDRRATDHPARLLHWHPERPLLEMSTPDRRTLFVEWDLARGEAREIGSSNERIVAARSPCGRWVVADRVDSLGRGLDLWDAERGEIVERLETRRYGASAIVFEPGSRRVALATSEGVFSLEIDDRRSARADLDELFAQHARAPADLELRKVLADALLELGDPRGELITLQTAIADGTADKQAPRREAELLAQHADAWTSMLPRIERASRRFERGFLVAVRTNAELEELERSLHVDQWATVEELEVNRFGNLGAIVRRMPALRTFSFRSGTPALAPGDQFPTLHALGCGTWVPDELDAFPNVRILGGTWARVVPNPDRHSQLLERLTALGIDALVHRFAEHYISSDCFGSAVRVRAAGPPELRFSIGAHSGTFDATGWAMAIGRADRHARLARGRDPDEPYRILPTLFDLLNANGVRLCDFHVPAREVDTVKAFALRHRIEVTFDAAAIELSR